MDGISAVDAVSLNQGEKWSSSISGGFGCDDVATTTMILPGGASR